MIVLLAPIAGILLIGIIQSGARRPMQRWPWITLAAAAIFAISPFGQNFIFLAFFSGEQLSRNIAQPLFFIGLAIVFVLVMLEWLLRWRISRRRDGK